MLDQYGSLCRGDGFFDGRHGLSDQAGQVPPIDVVWSSASAVSTTCQSAILMVVGGGVKLTDDQLIEVDARHRERRSSRAAAARSSG